MSDKTINELLPQLKALFMEDWNRTNFTSTSSYDVTFEEGSKFIKIIQEGVGRSVLGFICKVDVTRAGKTFKAGDLLKAAGWKAPAMNFRRGTIFDLDNCKNNIRWTGVG